MLKGRMLYSTKVKDHSDLGVYGIFNTTKVEWEYFVVSFDGNDLTRELCVVRHTIDYDRVKKFGKSVKDKQEGIEFITEYKDKWELGTNDTRQENRDRKINDVLDNN